MNPYLQQDMTASIRWALAEDIRDGDITAALIDSNAQAEATIITREQAVLCGTTWVDEVFQQLDPGIAIDWQAQDGDKVAPNQLLAKLSGNARNLLTGERCALNFLQTLSGTATRCRTYADKVADTSVKLLDTRKTIPGLRSAQKYAVTCGGCFNHRMGLYDAFLIKENHIAACGGIGNSIAGARQQHPDKPVEVEVESLEELKQALEAKADIIMLDNFSLEDMREAVAINQNRAKLEASGNVTDKTLRPIAETGVDFISIGVLTKDFVAVDLSMRVTC